MFFDTKLERTWATGLLGGCALLLGAPLAHAQSFSTPGYDSAPIARGSTLSLWGSEPRAPGQYALAVGLQTRLAGTTDGASNAEGAASSFGLLATLGLLSGLDASLALDLLRTQVPGEDANGEAQAQTALGDVRVIPRLRVWGDRDAGIALLVPTWIPAGSESVYSESGLRMRPELAATWSNPTLAITGQAGYQLHAAQDAWGTQANNFVGVGAGCEYTVAESVSVLGEIVGRWSPHLETAGDESPLGAEASGAVRVAMSDWAAQLGAGGGFTGGDSEPGFQVLASVSFNPASLDSLPPSARQAPEQRPEAVAQASEPNFYPNQTADWQPPEPTLEPEPEAKPEPSTGEALAASSGPSDPEPTSSEASPSEEPDLSQPTAALALSEPSAEVDEGGTHEVEPYDEEDDEQDDEAEVATLAPMDIVGSARAPQPVPLPPVPQVIHFAPNQMDLDAEQLAQLDEVAAILTALPEGVRLLVEGHSDNTGPRRFNRSLSRMRASTVRFHLLQRGIPWPRVGVRAFGASRPAVRGTSKEQLAQNRRVEFRLIRSR